jgi:hypothetical protein
MAAMEVWCRYSRQELGAGAPLILFRSVCLIAKDGLRRRATTWWQRQLSYLTFIFASSFSRYVHRSQSASEFLPP